ncbi:hypothetical protein BLOT_014921 [Blomia tropicalis]|nr:hypothetical protein BLOT_014921 [Blomia tropicalis]
MAPLSTINEEEEEAKAQHPSLVAKDSLIYVNVRGGNNHVHHCRKNTTKNQLESILQLYGRVSMQSNRLFLINCSPVHQLLLNGRQLGICLVLYETVKEGKQSKTKVSARTLIGNRKGGHVD